MTPATPPGGIRTTKASVYAQRAAQGIDLDKSITAHVEHWRDTVPAGTVVTLDKMLNCTSDCGCPPDRILTKCKGNSGHGLAIEIVMDHLFPPDGTDCTIPGVIGRTMHGPLQNPYLITAYARFIHKL